MRDPRVRRDPWLAGGLALLLLLSAGVVALYRSAPQSVAEVRTETWLATRPSAFGPNLARAEERLRAASAAPDDSSAIAALTEAAEAAWRARGLAADSAEAERATAVWGAALLDWAERVRVAGTGVGLRADDDPLLQRALALVESALTVPLPPPLAARAAAMREEIRRQLRPGPLEWLPVPR